mmetsp:Transcript_106370/g.343122  ORF Transcript_106370/g.343122 Transcript_106370/m.343122 type:complete len:200 (+) Transcript_106370:95-694(+)
MAEIVPAEETLTVGGSTEAILPTEQTLTGGTMSARSRFAAELERTVPRGGADELFAKYFAEIALDVVEEQTFRKRVAEEVGPRCVHLRLNAIGQVSLPPHIEENGPGEACCQLWTGHPKVDRNLFIQDRRIESKDRSTRELGTQRHVPALRASSVSKKNFGQKMGPRPFDDSFRSTILNRSKKEPVATQPVGHMDTLPM